MSDLSIDLLKEFTTKAYPEDALAGEGELLRDHALASAVIAVATSPKQLIKYLGRYLGSEVRSRYLVALAALLHDWGKALPPYQEYVRERGNRAPLRHEVTTFIVLTNLLRPTEGCEVPYLALTGSILYHHHGLYDFVESVVKYLAGHRVWPRGGAPEELISDLVSGLKDFLSSTSLSNYLVVSEDAANLLKQRELSSELLRRAAEVEGRVNSSRNVVTPLLTQLMIGDNAAASASRSSECRERGRLLLITKASAPTLVTHSRLISDLLSKAGLSSYVAGLGKVLRAVAEGWCK